MSGKCQTAGVRYDSGMTLPVEEPKPPPVPIALPLELLEAFDWARVFGGARARLPVELEIGTGKAGFLLRRARREPQRNFLGIEWANEFYKFAVDRLARWKVENVRMLRTDAARFVIQVCPRESLAVLHVYHPDPWPKRRHNRRRLFQPDFVAAAVSCLIPGGRICVQTDHAEYFQAIAGLLRAHVGLREVDFDDARFGVEAGVLGTNFEVKYVREGRALHRIAAERVAQHA